MVVAVAVAMCFYWLIGGGGGALVVGFGVDFVVGERCAVCGILIVVVDSRCYVSAPREYFAASVGTTTFIPSESIFRSGPPLSSVSAVSVAYDEICQACMHRNDDACQLL